MILGNLRWPPKGGSIRSPGLLLLGLSISPTAWDTGRDIAAFATQRDASAQGVEGFRENQKPVNGTDFPSQIRIQDAARQLEIEVGDALGISSSRFEVARQRISLGRSPLPIR